MITNEELRATFLSPAMKYYFDRKMAPLSSDEVNMRIEELLKYLNMATHSHGGIPFSPDIDDVWHYWIMQTKDYKLLCEKLDGGKFIHHTSNEYEEYFDRGVKQRPVDVQRAVSLLRSYVLNYGPFEQDRIRFWPAAEQVTQRLGWTAQQLNAWLEGASRPPPAEAATDIEALAA